MSYTELLSEYISNAKISMRKIAEKCNERGFSIDHSYISKIRRGIKPPPSEDLSRIIAEVCGGDPEALVLEGYKEKAPDKVKSLIEVGTAVNKEGIIQKPDSSKKYSMVIELADLLENNDIMVTASGKPLEHDLRLSLLRFIDKSVINAKVFSVPMLGIVRAGVPLLSQQNIIGEMDIPADLEGHVDFALEVRDDSMIGAGIAEYDIVLCKEVHIANNGDIVVALVNDDETTLKFYIQENGHAVLRAANPNYEDIRLNDGDQIQGRVVKVYKDPPSINLYRTFIHLQEEHLVDWNEVIETAIAGGVQPGFVKQFVENTIAMTANFAMKKSL